MNNKDEVFENFFNKTVNPRWPNDVGDSDHHLMTIFGIALQIKAKNILELGVRWGDTSEPLVMAASINDGTLTCVDTAPTLWECPEDLKPFYNFVKEDSIKFLENQIATDKYYDLIYVDDWHAYEHVKKELELIDQITTKKSIILLHDLMAFADTNGKPAEYMDCPDCPTGTEWSHGGPATAVLELDKSKWEWATIPINNGLTILRKIY